MSSFLMNDSSAKSDAANEYYCEVCQANMNSSEMLEKHVTGKKHLKNINKTITLPPQVKSVVKNVPPLIQPQLDELDVPVIGLGHIVEMNSSKSSCEPTYTCNLCNAGGDKDEIIDHILSTRHRMNHMEKTDPENFKMIESLCLMKCVKDPLVEEKARLLEQKEGKGTIEVREEVLSVRKRDYSNSDAQEYEQSKRKAYENCPEPARFRPRIPFNQNKVEQVRFYPFETKLRLLEELSQPNISSDSEAMYIDHAIKILSEKVVQFKAKSLPMHLRVEVLRNLFDPSIDYENHVDNVYRESSGYYWQRESLRGSPMHRNHYPH